MIAEREICCKKAQKTHKERKIEGEALCLLSREQAGITSQNCEVVVLEPKTGS